MLALLATALVFAIAVAVVGSLADSGLRWWSAIGQFRREARGELVLQQPLAPLRPAVSTGGCPGFDRVAAPRVTPERKRAA